MSPQEVDNFLKNSWEVFPSSATYPFLTFLSLGAQEVKGRSQGTSSVDFPYFSAAIQDTELAGSSGKPSFKLARPFS